MGDYKPKKYFEYKGHRYYEGTIAEFDNTGYPQAKYGKYSGVDDLFIAMISPTECFCNNRRLFSANEDNRKIIRFVKMVNNPYNIEMIKAYNDTDSDDMFYAWVIYIIAMIFSALTYDRIGWWIIITIIFYNYRKNKLYVSKCSYDIKKRTGGI